jgi:hypothetical protein
MSTLVIPHFSLFIDGWIRLTIYRLIYYRLTRNDSHNGNRLTKIMPGVPPGVPPPNDGFLVYIALHRITSHNIRRPFLPSVHIDGGVDGRSLRLFSYF